MDTNQLLKRFDDNNARVERIVLIASAIGSFGVSDELLDLLQSVDDKEIIRLFGSFPKYGLDALSEARVSGDDLAEAFWSIRKLGFLVMFATPVTRNWSGGSFSYTWGHCRSRLFYGETLEAAFEAGFAWVQESKDKDRAKEGLPALAAEEE